MSKTNGYQPTTIETLPSNGSGGTPPRKQSKFKAHFRKFWWLHLTSFVLSTILISLLLVYVGLPRIAQGDINKAELLAGDQDVTDPTPKNVLLKMVTTVVNHSPFRPTLDAFPVDLYLESSLPNYKAFGRLTIPELHAQKRSTITVQQTMDILDMQQFIEYNKLVTQSKEYRVALSGKTKLHLGALPVVSVNFNKVLTIKGLNGLKGLQVRDIKLSLTAGPDGSNMNGTLFIPNPSPMTLVLGDVVQEIYVKLPGGKPDLFIGNTTIPNLVLHPGDNSVPMKSSADQGKVLPLLSSTFKDAILPVQARTVSITYKGQRLEYFEAAMKATPVDTTLDLNNALKSLASQLGVDVALLTGGAPSGKTGGGSSSSSAGLGASPSTTAAGAAAPTAGAAAPPAATTAA